MGPTPTMQAQGAAMPNRRPAVGRREETPPWGPFRPSFGPRGINGCDICSPATVKRASSPSSLLWGVSAVIPRQITGRTANRSTRYLLHS
jgi:hypothetical protein